MDLQRLRIGFIGCGRLGTALGWLCARRGLVVSAASSRQGDRARHLARGAPGCQVLEAQEVADRCDLIFVTTPDAAIRAVTESLRWRKGSAVVHCSGATPVSDLAKAAADGAQIGGFHPLQTFGDPEAAARSLPGCTVTIEAAEPLDATLVALAQHLDCAVNRLPPGSRALYHAAAGYTSQFVNVLLHEAAAMWRSWGASEADAVKALLPLVRGTLASIEQAGVAKGMPGPVSRGDVASILKHVQAIEHFDPQRLDLYRALCHVTVKLALDAGRIDATAATRFQAVLSDDDADAGGDRNADAPRRAE